MQTETIPDYSSFKSSLNLILGFITALAIQNAIGQLSMFNASESTVRYLINVPWPAWLTFFTSITLIIRFFLPLHIPTAEEFFREPLILFASCRFD